MTISSDHDLHAGRKGTERIKEAGCPMRHLTVYFFSIVIPSLRTLISMPVVFCRKLPQGRG